MHVDQRRSSSRRGYRVLVRHDDVGWMRDNVYLVKRHEVVVRLRPKTSTAIELSLYFVNCRRAICNDDVGDRTSYSKFRLEATVRGLWRLNTRRSPARSRKNTHCDS